MIRIISRKVFRFYNPSQQLFHTLERKQDDGQTVVMQELAIPATMTTGRVEHKVGDLFFDTIPGVNGQFGEPQEAPDWVRAELPGKQNINTWRNAIADGSLQELAFVTDSVQGRERVVPQDQPETILAPVPGQPAPMPVIDSSAVEASSAAAVKQSSRKRPPVSNAFAGA